MIVMLNGIQEEEMKWSQDYATGVEQIDKDHQLIFQMSEDFRAALDEGLGSEVYSVMLDNLSVYCRGHFSFEEGTDNLTCPSPENLTSTFMRLPYSILKTHLS